MSTKPVPQARRRLILALISLFTLLPTTLYLQTRTPHCPPSLILTAPSHGYTWYTRSLHTKHLSHPTYPNTTTPPKVSITTLSTFHNHSILILPPLDARARELVRLARGNSVPVVVLRREVSGAYREYLETGGVEAWERWEESVDGFFANVGQLLREEGVVADWLWFDNVVWRRLVWLHRNACHVRNHRAR